MPADFSEYINLIPFDVSPTSVYLDAIEYAKLTLPEFQPRQGTPEDAILQAVSYISALNIAAINRLPDRLMSGILGMMGVERDDGTHAVIDVLFTGIDEEGTTIPQSTILRYDYELLGERRSVYFETVEDGVIEPGSPVTVVVEARAIDVGIILPVTEGLELSIDSPTSNILSASVDSFVSQGSNTESDGDYLNRAVQYLASLSSAFAKPSQIEGYVLSFFSSNVGRCKVYDLTNPSSGLEWDDADEPGYVTIVAYGIDNLLAVDEKIDILTSVQERTVAGLEVDVIDPYIADISVSVDVTYSPEYESTVIVDNIKAVIANYFSPSNYRFSDGIKLSEFYAVASSVPGVVYVSEIVLTAGDNCTTDGDGNIEFAKKGTLPTINTDETFVVTATALAE